MSSTDQMGLESEAGISKEDQQDILSEIEKVATQNRIATSDQDFVVKAMKRGVLFPSVVIAAAAVGLVAGAAAFYLLFQRGEQRIVRGEVGTITVEGQLIEAVRRDADTKIQQKNLEINSIQGRLADIDRQRQDLQSNMDARVSEKEQALRAEMAAALITERDKLLKQGLSQREIDQRIQQLQAQRNVQLERDLDSFRKEAEAQRLQAEQNLKTLQEDYSANLARANAERQQTITDAQNREQSLRGQLAQNTKALEAATASAQQALNALAAQRQKEDLVTGQLVGLYAVAQADIARQDYDKALASLQSLKGFVEKTDVASLPAIARRHDFDEFVIDSLTRFVQEEIVKARTDTASLLEAANELAALRQHVSQAQELVTQGKAEEAAAEFDSAIRTIPEVAASYAYFVGRDQQAEASRQARLADALDKAEAAFSAGSYTAAAASYRTALAYLPVSTERLDRAVSNLQAVGTVTGSQQAGQAQSRGAGNLLTQADTLRSQGKLDEALAGYIDLLGRYPLAAQVRDALAGIQAAVAGLNLGAATALRQQQQSLAAQISSLQQDLTGQRASVTDLQKSLAGSRDDNARLLAQIDSLNTQLRQVNVLAAQGQVSERQRQALQDRFDAMQKSYGDYTALEDPILKAKGDIGMMDTKPYFDAFFRSAAIQAAFPGLPARVKRYDQGFQAAGRSDALQDAVAVIVNFAQQGTNALKRTYLQQQLRAYSQDPDMVELLQEMDQRLTGR